MASAAGVTTTAADDGDLQFNSAASAVSTTGVTASNALRVKMTPVTSGQLLEGDNTGTGKTSSTDRVSMIRFSTASLEPTFTSATVSLTTFLAAANQFGAGQTLFLYGMSDGSANGQNFTNATTAATFLYGTGLFSKTDLKRAGDSIADRVNDSMLTPLAAISITTAATTSTTYTFASDSLTAYVLAQKAAGSTAAFIIASDVLPDAIKTNTPAFFSADNTTTGHVSPTLATSVAVPEPAALGGAALAVPALPFRRVRRGG